MNLLQKVSLAKKIGHCVEWDDVGPYVWSATNGNKCYLKDWNSYKLNKKGG